MLGYIYIYIYICMESLHSWLLVRRTRRQEVNQCIQEYDVTMMALRSVSEWVSGAEWRRFLETMVFTLRIQFSSLPWHWRGGRLSLLWRHHMPLWRCTEAQVDVVTVIIAWWRYMILPLRWRWRHSRQIEDADDWPALWREQLTYEYPWIVFNLVVIYVFNFVGTRPISHLKFTLLYVFTSSRYRVIF